MAIDQLSKKRTFFSICKKKPEILAKTIDQHVTTSRAKECNNLIHVIIEGKTLVKGESFSRFAETKVFRKL